MNWYAIWTAIVAALELDPEIGAVMGSDTIWLDGERPLQVPSMTALLVVNTESEMWAPADWQFDIYTRTLEDAVRVEQALMRLLNQPMAVAMGDAEFTAEFQTGQLLRGPHTDPYFRRQLEFRFTPVRSRYYRPQPVGG